LTEGEAAAFTQLFCENIRNNVDQWVVAAVAEAAGTMTNPPTLSPEVHAELQLRIGQYAGAYQFRSTTPFRGMTPLERHRRAVAEEWLRQSGLDVPTEAEVAARALDPAVGQEAAVRLAAERAVADQALAALL
jgi:hypothetical protein